MSSPLKPPTGTERTLPPSAPIAPTSPSHPQSTTPNPPFRPIFLTLLIATPLLAALPPRKLDMYTFMLGAAFVVSAEELTFGTASNRYWQQRQRIPALETESVPLAASSSAAQDLIANDSAAPGDIKARIKEQRRKEEGVSGLARRLWYGPENTDWKERRIREEKEALEEGRGYGGLIGDAVREVFGGAVEREDVERFNRERAREREKERKGGDGR